MHGPMNVKKRNNLCFHKTDDFALWENLNG